jgi:predicted metal-dependent phosphoesterase TrpH
MAADMMKMYAEKGYTTVFVSDHFSQGFFKHYPEQTWAEQVHTFFRGYRAAKEAGDKLGLIVLPAAEIGFNGSPNHYLIYGASEEFLAGLPEILNYSVEEFYEIAKANDILLINAHPYRDNPDNKPTPHCVDGIEIFNSNPGHDDHSDMAYRLALDNGLFMTAGSDTHQLQDVGGTAVLSETPIRTPEDYVKPIRSGKAKIMR